MLTLINIYFYQHDQGCINRTQKLALVLLGELLGSCIFWGTVDRCIGRHLSQLSINLSAAMLADTRSTLDQCACNTQLLQSIGR